MLYSNGNSAFSGSDLSSPRGSTKTESLNSNSPAQVTEINSDDDSLDSQDAEKVRSASLRRLSRFAMISHRQVKSLTSRKRNPYSIEELLKKPEKRRKVELRLSETAITRDLEKDGSDVGEEPVNVETCD